MSKLRRRAALTFAVMTVASAVAAAPATASTTATVSSAMPAKIYATMVICGRGC